MHKDITCQIFLKKLMLCYIRKSRSLSITLNKANHKIQY